MAKKKRKKYAFGTSAVDPNTELMQLQYEKLLQSPGYIPSPDESLTANDIRTTRANLKSNNWLTKSLDVVGNLGIQAGMMTMDAGMSKGQGVSKNGFNWGQLVKAGSGVMGAAANTFAFGGEVGQVPIEVEGDEVAETPNDDLILFDGPSHEQGGIDTSLPKGSKIYSDRIKIDNVTLSKRKQNRERLLNKIKKKHSSNPTDQVLKNTLKRTEESTSIEENMDLNVQQKVRGYMKGNKNTLRKKYADGTENLTGNEILPQELLNLPTPSIFTDTTPNVDVPVLPNVISDGVYRIGTNNNTTPEKPFVPGVLPLPSQKFDPALPTVGDVAAISGDLYQAFALNKNTQENRAGDTPNINPFKRYGKKALQRLEKIKTALGAKKEQALQDLQLSKTNSQSQNRGGARSINTMRALDLASEAVTQRTAADIENSYLNGLIGIETNIADAELKQDSVVMGAEQVRMDNDVKDRDNYYKQRGQDLAHIGESISRTGKNVNAIKRRKVDENLLNNLADYVKVNTSTGNVEIKDGVDITNPNLTGNVEKRPSSSSSSESITDIPEWQWSNYENPITQQPFSSIEEFADYKSKMSRYSPELKEVDTSYKTKIDPLTKVPFSNMGDYLEYTNTPGVAELQDYIPLKGNKNIYSKFDFSVDKQQEVENILSKKGLSLDLDNKDQIKQLQKTLGIKEDGVFGDDTYQALLKLK